MLRPLSVFAGVSEGLFRDVRHPGRLSARSPAVTEPIPGKDGAHPGRGCVAAPPGMSPDGVLLCALCNRRQAADGAFPVSE